MKHWSVRASAICLLCIAVAVTFWYWPGPATKILTYLEAIAKVLLAPSTIATTVAVTVSTAVAAAGWVIGHRLNLRQKRLETGLALRTQYLVDAYRRLEDASGRAMNEEDLIPVKRIFESAVADIQLLGTRQQIEALLEHIRRSLEKGSMPTLDPVLELLRSELRKELHLDLDIPPVHQYRFKRA